MITSIVIENYKSIHKLNLEVGRFNVLIGENGCGKSNILEAVTFSAAAEANNLVVRSIDCLEELRYQLVLYEGCRNITQVLCDCLSLKPPAIAYILRLKQNHGKSEQCVAFY